MRSVLAIAVVLGLYQGFLEPNSAVAKSCEKSTAQIIKQVFNESKHSPQWKIFADKADEHYANLARLEHEERLLHDIHHRIPAQEHALAVARQRLEQERDEFAAFNKKNHEFLQFLREPDQAYRLVEKVDQQAQVFRDQLVALDEQISAHQELVQNLTGKERKFADAQLKKFETKRALAEKNLKPLQEKIDAVFDRIPPEERIKQITGKDNVPGEKPKHIETADPAFYFMSRGRVQVIGSGWVDREYASMDHLMRNVGEKVTYTDLRYPDGEIIENKVYGMGGPVWDKSIVKFENGEEVLYTSALSPKKYRVGGLPTDAAYTTTHAENWTRRIYGFHKRVEIVHPVTGEAKIWKSYAEFLKSNPDLSYYQLKDLKPHSVWVRNRTDLWGNTVPMEVDWTNHSYGVKVRTNPDGSPWLDEKGQAYAEYEKVVTHDPAHLGNTHPYSQPLGNPFQVTGKATKLMETEYEHVTADGKTVQRAYNMAIRSFNRELRLIEGPQRSAHFLTLDDLPDLNSLPPETRAAFRKRYGNAEKFSIVSTAAGDYPTKDYGLHVGLMPIDPKAPLSAQMGPLIPLVEMRADGTYDLVHLGREQGIRYRQSWGPSRPLFFKYRGRWWMMNHATDETATLRYLNARIWEPDHEIDNFFRVVNLVPADPTILPDGQISFIPKFGRR